MNTAEIKCSDSRTSAMRWPVPQQPAFARGGGCWMPLTQESRGPTLRRRRCRQSSAARRSAWCLLRVRARGVPCRDSQMPWPLHMGLPVVLGVVFPRVYPVEFCYVRRGQIWSRSHISSIWPCPNAHLAASGDCSETHLQARAEPAPLPLCYAHFPSSGHGCRWPHCHRHGLG